MSKYNIVDAGTGDNYVCCIIDAETEYRALQRYKTMRASSGQWWLEKTPKSNKYTLLSSFGGCYIAEKTIQND